MMPMPEMLMCLRTEMSRSYVSEWSAFRVSVKDPLGHRRDVDLAAVWWYEDAARYFGQLTAGIKKAGCRAAAVKEKKTVGPRVLRACVRRWWRFQSGTKEMCG